MIGPKRPWGPEVIRLIEEHVGRRLKERRVTLGITRVDLARFLNVPKEILEAYETGEVTMPASDLYALAKTLKVRTGYFHEGLYQHFGTTVYVDAKPSQRQVDDMAP